MEPHEKVYRSKKEIFIDNFIGGIAWAAGSMVGLAIMFAIVGYLLSRIDLVPILGDFLGNVMRDMVEKNPQLANPN